MKYKVVIGVLDSVKLDENHFNVICTYDLEETDFSELNSLINIKGAKVLSCFGAFDRYKIFYKNKEAIVNKDDNGKELIAFDPRLLLEDLVKKIKSDAYHRYFPLISLLESMLENFKFDFYAVLYEY